MQIEERNLGSVELNFENCVLFVIYLGLDHMSDADLGHDGDGDGGDDLTDHTGVGHTSDTT